jgi:hypothetical protein
MLLLFIILPSWMVIINERIWWLFIGTIYLIFSLIMIYFHFFHLSDIEEISWDFAPIISFVFLFITGIFFIGAVFYNKK